HPEPTGGAIECEVVERHDAIRAGKTDLVDAIAGCVELDTIERAHLANELGHPCIQRANSRTAQRLGSYLLALVVAAARSAYALDQHRRATFVHAEDVPCMSDADLAIDRHVLLGERFPFGLAARAHDVEVEVHERPGIDSVCGPVRQVRPESPAGRGT